MTRISGIDFGKVRNTGLLTDGRRVLHTTDRISAFDAILPFEVPGKGAILQALSLWFFRATRDIVRNHVVGALGPNHMLVESAAVFPVELVVRGFLTGSLWRLYAKEGPDGVWSRYGVRLPAGLSQGARFERPLLTPTSKARAGHDEPITLAACARLVPDFDRVQAVCLALFERGQAMARERGLELVDTKYEMGTIAGELVLVDEVHTPDSSRYWLREDVGKPHPRSLSKEFFREILTGMFGGVEKMELDFADHPHFRDREFVSELTSRIAARYQEVFTLLTGAASPAEVAGAGMAWPVDASEFAKWEEECRLPQRVLVCGNGGRDHALAAALERHAEVRTVYFSPGDRLWGGKCRPLPPAAGASMNDVARAARECGVGLVVAGPELPIVQGIGDACRAEGIPAVAPSVACAALEWSKIFAKEVATEADIPTAKYEVMDWAELRPALRLAAEEGGWERFSRSAPFVLKYDGLAAGKGVFLVRTREDARLALETLESELASWQRLSPSGEARFLVEDLLSGDEISVIALCNGRDFRLLPCARDYKRRDDGQRGPNTGGMGSVCPVEVGDGLLEQFRLIFSRTLEAMERRGLPYRGFLYAGCMVDAENRAWLLEYNCRLGDPECQVMVPGLGRDFFTEVWRVAQGLAFWEPEKSGTPFVHDGRTRVLVVAASPEYPLGMPVSRRIHFPSRPAAGWEAAGISWSPAGVDASGTTRAGRILGAVGEGVSVADARARAYEAIAGVVLENQDGSRVAPHFRRDIAADLVEALP